MIFTPSFKINSVAVLLLKKNPNPTKQIKKTQHLDYFHKRNSAYFTFSYKSKTVIGISLSVCAVEWGELGRNQA